MFAGVIIFEPDGGRSPANAAEKDKMCKTWSIVLALCLSLGLPLGLYSGPATAEQTLEPTSCDARPNAIAVTVTDVRSGAGTITVDLYDDVPESFLKGKRKLSRVRAPARHGTVRLCLVAPKPGIYALAIYHDENANKKFDRNFIGLPTEAYGVSNNPGFRLGPPSHDEAAFSVGAAGIHMEIDLRH
jgi:uncharacterized protein (DUF2141 family)